MNRHGRFLAALGLGLVAGAGGLAMQLPPELAALTGVDVTFIVYLVLMLHLASSTSHEDIRRRAESADEGVALILLLGTLTVAISLAVIVRILAGPSGMMGALGQGLSLTAVPLGWAMLQVMAAFHYGHLYYRQGDHARGLDFPGTTNPGPWDFLYFSFGVGMTAQVSDVATRNAAMRRVVLVHSIASFFYNTVILALAINAALALGG
jgi:uncharacterized membrane protein